MEKIYISIVTVVYNNKKGIAKTIESVTNQSYRGTIEYIIIDGGSTDGTLEVIDNFRDSINHVISEPDLGIYDAMNKGIRLAKGDLVGIINSGDFLELDAVEHVISAYLRNPLYDVYHGVLRIFSEEGQMLSVKGSRCVMLQNEMIQHPTCFVNKSVYEKFGSYSLKYRSSSDYEFMLRIWINGAKFCFLEKVLANYFTGGMSCQPIALVETARIRHNYKLIPKVNRIRQEAVYILKKVFK